MDLGLSKGPKKAILFAWLHPEKIEVTPLRYEAGWFWKGPFCGNQPACQRLLDRCELQAHTIERLENDTDLDIELKEEWIEVGLYQVKTCTQGDD